MWKYLILRRVPKGKIGREPMASNLRSGARIFPQAPIFPLFSYLSVTLITCHQMNIEATSLKHELCAYERRRCSLLSAYLFAISVSWVSLSRSFVHHLSLRHTKTLLCRKPQIKACHVTTSIESRICNV